MRPTVTVSLAGAGLDKGCCFRFYPHSNKGEAERDYTFYLRHKPSDEDDWTGPVELTFSDFAADVRLTGLDPGTDYDVEVAENQSFTPPPRFGGQLPGNADGWQRQRCVRSRIRPRWIPGIF